MQAHRAERGLCYRPISEWRKGEAGRYIYIPGSVPYVMSVLTPPRVTIANRHTARYKVMSVTQALSGASTVNGRCRWFGAMIEGRPAMYRGAL